ncbi:hypothetical protein [Spirosoma montaniterrae]|uniref:Thioredoxin domain-containing protein n=1 Tax=Spirosoma montaniterrae TaxID=1178516 RepID=A0A1P9X2W9_9BACT|nr:hypothetical protein [Spirosoma montaniterrae]AQG81945.1 hypothetical protein AWR27_23200 [Spirosoma montaniterrae]
MPHRCLFLFIILSVPLFAQTPDSVTVTGRIRNLSARLYRESPTVLVSRNNILQAGREFIRPAPLNADGTFRVTMPLVYAQEEMYFNYGRISTPFLAAPGTLTIDLNADSLFTASVPFRFGGVNAQVNQQFARFKAFEAISPQKTDVEELPEKVQNLDDQNAFKVAASTYQTPFLLFTRQEKPFPLLTRWVMSAGNYNAASFLYDKASYESKAIVKVLNDSLRPPNDRLLTAARASAMNRFAEYVVQQQPTTTSGNTNLSVRTLSGLLLRYGRNLTPDERSRLETFQEKNTAIANDLRFFTTIIRRNDDSLQRIINYESLIQRAGSGFGSASAEYVAAYWLAAALPGLTLNFAQLLYDHARRQLTDPALTLSLDELYRLEVKDSTRIRAAVQTTQKANGTANALEISPGVFINQNPVADGRTLFDRVVDANRGKVVYVLLTSAETEAGRQAALDAQRIREQYGPRNVALVYLTLITTDTRPWVEFSAKHNLAGDHLLLNVAQISDVMAYLRPTDDVSATIINRVGKVGRRNAPLPDAPEELRKVLEKNL